jgi:hypothetical protein
MSLSVQIERLKDRFEKHFKGAGFHRGSSEGLVNLALNDHQLWGKSLSEESLAEVAATVLAGFSPNFFINDDGTHKTKGTAQDRVSTNTAAIRSELKVFQFEEAFHRLIVLDPIAASSENKETIPPEKAAKTLEACIPTLRNQFHFSPELVIEGRKDVADRASTPAYTPAIKRETEESSSPAQPSPQKEKKRPRRQKRSRQPHTERKSEKETITISLEEILPQGDIATREEAKRALISMSSYSGLVPGSERKLHKEIVDNAERLLKRTSTLKERTIEWNHSAKEFTNPEQCKSIAKLVAKDARRRFQEVQGEEESKAFIAQLAEIIVDYSSTQVFLQTLRNTLPNRDLPDGGKRKRFSEATENLLRIQNATIIGMGKVKGGNSIDVTEGLTPLHASHILSGALVDYSTKQRNHCTEKIATMRAMMIPLVEKELSHLLKYSPERTSISSEEISHEEVRGEASTLPHPTKASRVYLRSSSEERDAEILDGLMDARNADWISLEFLAGRTIEGSIVFNLDRGMGRILNIDDEISVDFHIQEIKAITIFK